MKECCLHIEAHDLKVMVIGIGQQDLDTAEFNNRCVCFPKVLQSLAETLGDESSFFFASYNGTIRIVLVVIRPADTHCFATRW